MQALCEDLQAASSTQEGAPQAAWPKVDEAVSALLAHSRHSQLHGVFFGRLHSLATVLAPSDAVAVNAVLSELCNLVSVSACKPEQQHVRCSVLLGSVW